MKRLALVDYAGHPFQIALSRQLARNGWTVDHIYASDVVTGQGNLADAVDGLTIRSAPFRGQSSRSIAVRRVVVELRWGLDVVRIVRQAAIPLLMLSNVPLLAQFVIACGLRRSSTRLVLWQQDVHSRAIRAVLSRRSRTIGAAVGWFASRMERYAARRTSMVIAISEAFRPTLLRWGVPQERITIIPNWAPIEEMPLCADPAELRSSLGVPAGARLAVYSGTLGYKHNPEPLLRLAEAFQHRGHDEHLLVVSEGTGRARLDEAHARNAALPLTTADYVPFDQLPCLLGAADVLIAILEADAGEFSIPSKVLSYFCAERPVVALMPPENDAARLIREVGAGESVDVRSSDPTALIDAVTRYLDDSALSAATGQTARQYAEQNFRIEDVALRFEAVLARLPHD